MMPGPGAGEPAAPGPARGLRDGAFGGHVVRPGDTAQVDLKVSEAVTHEPVRIPVTVVRGRRDGPTVHVMSAIHGDEVNGVAIVRRLLDGLSGGLERGTLIAVPVANTFGFAAGERYLPDRRDLNRHFPGEPGGSMASRIAHELFREVVLVSDFGVDLHTAASGNTNLCHIRGDAQRPDVKPLMRAFGTPVMVHGDGPRGSLRRAATEAGVPSILFEAGEPHRFQRHVVEIGHLGLRRLLAHLGMTDEAFDRPELQVLLRDTDWIRSDHGGILDLWVEPGDLVEAGQVLGALVDPYGRRVDQVESDRNGVVLGVSTNPRVHPGMAMVHVGALRKTWDAAKAYVASGGDMGHIHWVPRTRPPRGVVPIVDEEDGE